MRRSHCGLGRVWGGGALPEEGHHVLAERVAQEAPHVGQILSGHVGVVRRGPAVSQPGDFAAQRAQRRNSLLRCEEDADAPLLLRPLQLLPAEELGQHRLGAVGAQKLGAEQLDGARAEGGDQRVVEGRQQRDTLVVGGGQSWFAGSIALLLILGIVCWRYPVVKIELANRLLLRHQLLLRGELLSLLLFQLVRFALAAAHGRVSRQGVSAIVLTIGTGPSFFSKVAGNPITQTKGVT